MLSSLTSYPGRALHENTLWATGSWAVHRALLNETPRNPKRKNEKQIISQKKHGGVALRAA